MKRLIQGFFSISLLLSVMLSASCSKPSTRTILIPSEPCLMPPIPQGQGRLDMKDCDGEGPETTICIAEESVMRIGIYMQRLRSWAALASTCPGMSIETNSVPVPAVARPSQATVPGVQ